MNPYRYPPKRNCVERVGMIIELSILFLFFKPFNIYNSRYYL